MRNKNYEKETFDKGKAIGETSNPLMIEKLDETMSKRPKGVLRRPCITLTLGLLQTSLWLKIYPKPRVQCQL